MLDIADSESGTEMHFAEVDPRVSYPSYKSMDEFIDIERLRSLDGYIRNKIKRRLTEHDDPKFYTGPYTLEEDKEGRHG
ncbi:MAG: hypothetical protein ACJ72Z_11560 [Pyrinomonadaceae bacterium]